MLGAIQRRIQAAPVATPGVGQAPAPVAVARPGMESPAPAPVVPHPVVAPQAPAHDQVARFGHFGRNPTAPAVQPGRIGTINVGR